MSKKTFHVSFKNTVRGEGEFYQNESIKLQIINKCVCKPTQPIYIQGGKYVPRRGKRPPYGSNRPHGSYTGHIVATGHMAATQATL